MINGSSPGPLPLPPTFTCHSLTCTMRSATDRQVHTSMYETLRTNLPRELMGVSGFPFTPEVMGERSKDHRRYCGHAEVRV